MKSRLLCALAVSLLLGLFAGVSPADPAGQWTLDFSNRGLQHVIVTTPQGPVVYYYIPYEVTNKTGADLAIRPSGKIVTETGQTLAATPDPQAALEICKKLGREMLDIDAMAKEPLPDGKSRQGLFIWYGLDDRADHLDVYLYGLSNEYKYTDEKARTGYLRKAYQIKIFRPGGELDRQKSPINVEKEGWAWVPTDVTPAPAAAPAPADAPAPAPAPDATPDK